MTVPTTASLTPDWVRDAVFYQIFPDRFARSGRVEGLHLQAWGSPPTVHGYQGGDLWGVAERLEYLQNLGVNAIYFCPVFQSASNHRYHTHDYFQVDPMLGGNAALRWLLDEAHRRGMRVVLDGVFNHASRGFFQFNDLLESGEQSAYRDWFHVYGWPVNAYDESRPPNYAAWWGLHALPKFNTSHAAVREFLLGVAEFWIRFGIDGWRLDVPNEIDDDAFWQEFRRRVKAANPEAYIVGEIWDEAHRWLSGDQFDAVMNYHFTRPCLAFFAARTLQPDLTGRSGLGQFAPIDAAEFARQMTDAAQMYHPDIVRVQLNLLDSHDTPRFLTAAGGDQSAHHLALIFQMTYIGAPCLYYGDEIGLSGGPDPDCRRAFPWNETDWNTESWNTETLALVQKLTAARHRSEALRQGDFVVLHAQREGLVFARPHASGTAYILMNTGQEPAALPLSGVQPGLYRDAMSHQTFTLSAEATLTVSPRSALLLLPAQDSI